MNKLVMRFLTTIEGKYFTLSGGTATIHVKTGHFPYYVIIQILLLKYTSYKRLFTGIVNIHIKNRPRGGNNIHFKL
ncbi:hypothetical protein LOR37_23005 (plasmid) [Clostridium estertheticum]|uniref:hypothetical protein n=1 Tax=Clostridium estertheticum TaxID=238834 RepID=UPI0022DD45E4|nr:hypothetical protein [Clostridium estertheticum]WBL49644.1 hypothetical protein LOR37_23005 [Clostridium estertheticum]